MVGHAISGCSEISNTSCLSDPSTQFSEQGWFAAYVNSRHEKSVARQLDERRIERFLPLYESTHRWNNGRHQVQLPLFPGYVFVRLLSSDRLKVLEVPGVRYIVSSHGIPTPLPLQEIERLRNAFHSGVVAQPFPYLTLGTFVEIRKGPLQGVAGILKRRCGKYRVVISVESIMQSIAVEVDVCDIAPIRSTAFHHA